MCNDTGHSTSNWEDLVDRESNPIAVFPVNDCEGQLKDGNVSPCPSTPDKYDIIGFTRLKIVAVYEGDDPAAIGTPGASGTCDVSKVNLTNGQVKPLSDTYGSGGGCPEGRPTPSTRPTSTSPRRPGSRSCSACPEISPDVRVLV